MAFTDRPQVDRSSKNSNTSEIRFQEVFSQMNGFISRADVPDKGCDFDIELITDEKNASGWRFASQLKSIEKLKLVSDGAYISYAFETSRLGYLISRQPAMGIIVLYSIESNKLYFDYVDLVYERICNERENDGWKQNDQVNIRIPIQNELSGDAIAKLHQTFVVRFEQATKMQLAYGNKYNLPTIGLNKEFKYDFNNIEHVKKVLKDFGLAFLSKHDLTLVYNLITKIPNAEIYQSKELQIIAAIANSEAGSFADSQLFINRLLKKTDLTAEERQMIDFTKLKNDLVLGIIDQDQFMKKSEELKSNIGEGINSITLEINITFYKLLSIKALKSVGKKEVTSIQNVFDKLEALNYDESTKKILETWNTENLSLLVAHFRSKYYGELRIRESLGGEFTFAEKKVRVEFLAFLTSTFFSRLGKINKFANESDFKLLKAYVISVKIRHVLSNEIDQFKFKIKALDDQSKNLLENDIKLCIAAFNIFGELDHYKDAYNSLCDSLELLSFARFYGIESPIESNNLYAIKIQIEEAFGLEAKELIIAQMIENAEQENLSGEEMKFTMRLDDEQIEALAKMTLESLRIPYERLINIIDEMKAYRLFYNRCTDDNVMVLQYDIIPRTPENAYQFPIRFVIRSKATGIETPPSADMDQLLKHWKL